MSSARWFAVLLWLFYRRIDVVGRERIPESGGVIIAANHHNALVDAMLVIVTVPRAITVLAKAPLFRHPLIGLPLRLMGAVPVHRRAEAGDDPRKNDEMFAAAIEALRTGGVVLIFPEGRAQPQPVLLPLRTGAARLVLGAERATGGAGRLPSCPSAWSFTTLGTFRSASVQITVGHPVETADLVAAHRDRPEEAVKAITARLTESIGSRIVEAQDQYSLELLAVLERSWWEEAVRRGEPAPTPGRATEHALAWKQRVMRAGRYLAAREPHRVAALRRRIELYRSHLDEVGITSAAARPAVHGRPRGLLRRDQRALAGARPAAGVLGHRQPRGALLADRPDREAPRANRPRRKRRTRWRSAS